jgi:hypothetical protein
MNIKTKELGRSILASISKQRTYKGGYAPHAETVKYLDKRKSNEKTHF